MYKRKKKRKKKEEEEEEKENVSNIWHQQVNNDCEIRAGLC